MGQCGRLGKGWHSGKQETPGQWLPCSGPGPSSPTLPVTHWGPCCPGLCLFRVLAPGQARGWGWGSSSSEQTAPTGHSGLLMPGAGQQRPSGLKVLVTSRHLRLTKLPAEGDMDSRQSLWPLQRAQHGLLRAWEGPPPLLDPTVSGPRPMPFRGLSRGGRLWGLSEIGCTRMGAPT